MTGKKKYTRTVTCPRCKEKIDRNIEEFAERNNRYYHEKCYNEVDASSRERRELLDYINDLYKGAANFVLVSKQIKDLVEEHNYSLKSIELTLRYFYEIQGHSIYDSKGVGIVPFVYEEAKAYYIRLDEIRKSVEGKDFNKTRIITTRREGKTKKRRKKIDIGGIE